MKKVNFKSFSKLHCLRWSVESVKQLVGLPVGWLIDELTVSFRKLVSLLAAAATIPPLDSH